MKNECHYHCSLLSHNSKGCWARLPGGLGSLLQENAVGYWAGVQKGPAGPLTCPFPLLPQDPHSGCPSRSSSSLSFHSTPPPLPLLQQSPATLPLALPGAPAQLPPQPQNGLGRAPAAGLGAMPMAEGLLGGLAGSGSLPLNGLLGGLNGAAAPNPSGLSQAGGAPTLQLPGCLNR